MKKTHIFKRLMIRVLISSSVMVALAGVAYWSIESNSQDELQESKISGTLSIMGEEVLEIKDDVRELLLLRTIDLDSEKKREDVLVQQQSFKLSQTVQRHRIWLDEEMAALKHGVIRTNGDQFLIKPKTFRELQSEIILLSSRWTQFKKTLDGVQNSNQFNDYWRAEVDLSSQAIQFRNDLLTTRAKILNELQHQRLVKKRILGIIIGLLLALGILSSILFYYKLIYVINTMLTSTGFAHPIPQSRGSRYLDYSNLFKEMDLFNKRIRELIGLTREISSTTSFNETLTYIFRTFKPYIPYSYIGIAVYKAYESDIIVAKYGVSDGMHPELYQRLSGYETTIDSTSLLEVQKNNVPRVINNLKAYGSDQELKEYTRILLEEGVRSSITLPLSINRRPLGFIFFSSHATDVYKPEHAVFLKAVAAGIALAFEKNIFTDELVFSSILALAKLAEARDEDTGNHLERIRSYTQLLLQCMKFEGVYADTLTQEFIFEVERFSPIHDIGKVGIRDEVLLKQGKLTLDEFEHMKTHASYGAEVLKEAEENINRSGRSLFKIGIEIAEGHHERWDGTGYPMGLCGEAIPLSARIVAVADVLDALTSKRPYKKAYTFDDSVRIICENSGTHFDPSLVQCVVNHIDEFHRLYQSMGQEEAS